MANGTSSVRAGSRVFLTKFRLRSGALLLLVLSGFYLASKSDVITATTSLITSQMLGNKFSHDTARHDLKERKMRRIIPPISAVSCPLLWQNDSQEMTKATEFQKNWTLTVKSTQDYFNATRNCTYYRQNGGFGESLVSEEERSFALAFSLIVYRDADQVEHLLRAIYRPHNVYCIHVDTKSHSSFWIKIKLIVRCLPNVFLSNETVDVQWGKFTNLYPEVLCMRQLWEKNVKWRYFINLTGQEFPLKTNRELVQILKAYRGANGIAGASKRNTDRWSKFLPAPFNLVIYKGPVHIVASREFADYVLHSNVSRQLLEWVKPTGHPDESYFNTLNHNPQLGVPGSVSSHQNYEDNDSFARYKIWGQAPVHPCSGKLVRDVCNFGVGDLPLLTSSPQLIANKFSYNYERLAYLCLQEWYFHKVQLEEAGLPVSLNISLYESSKVVRNRYTGPIKVW